MFQSKSTSAYTRPDSSSAPQRPTRPELGQERNNLWLAMINSSHNTQLRTHYGKYLLRQTQHS